MQKEVIVTIKGLQIHEAAGPDDNCEELELVTVGEYFLKNGKKYIMYDEVSDGGKSSIRTVVKVAPDVIEITKRGDMNTHLMFQKGKKSLTYYRTPFGELQMGITGDSIDINETEDRMEICIRYALEISYEHIADCTVNITVESKDNSQLSLGI